MDKKKLPISGRLEDRTGDNNLQRFLNYMLVQLNPVYAYRKARTPDGTIPASEGVDLRTNSKGYINALVNKQLLAQIMSEDDLVDPKVVLSGKYGDLIPKDRWGNRDK
jgi:hypothetical protein